MAKLTAKKMLVNLLDIQDPPVRIRADSMRGTVIVEIRETDYTKAQTFILPKRADVLDSLGVALTQAAMHVRGWEIEASDLDN